MSRCELGCFNRPWSQFEFTDFLTGTKEAGYALAGFMRQKGEAVLDVDSPPGQAAKVKGQVGTVGLAPSTLLAGMKLGAPVEEGIRHFKKVIDVAAACGVGYILTCGTNEQEHRSNYCEIIKRTADYAADRDVMLTLKPHGGISATSRELRAIHDSVAHPNFGIYYDPGNIHYYTGESAAEDVIDVANWVVAMCIKDNTGGVHGDVAIEPGTGEVDFGAVFDELFDAGFDGPCLVECLGGKTLDEINDSARRTYDLLVEHLARAE